MTHATFVLLAVAFLGGALYLDAIYRVVHFNMLSLLRIEARLASLEQSVDESDDEPPEDQ